MNGTDALISLIRALEKVEMPYIDGWCAKHQTLDLLAEAKTEAAPAWEEA